MHGVHAVSLNANVTVCLGVNLRRVQSADTCSRIDKNIKYPMDIMAFGVVTSNGVGMLLFIFPHSIGLNTEEHIKRLEEVVLP